MGRFKIYTPDMDELYRMTDIEKRFGFYFGNIMDVHNRITEGLPSNLFDYMACELDMKSKELAGILGISVRTLGVRKKSGCFNTEESERLFRLAWVYNRLKESFYKPERVAEWMKEPSSELGMKTPMEFCRTIAGSLEVINVVHRIQDGMPA